MVSSWDRFPIVALHGTRNHGVGYRATLGLDWLGAARAIVEKRFMDANRGALIPTSRALRIAVVMAGFFIGLSVLLRYSPDNSADRVVLDWIAQWEAPFIDEFMAAISWLNGATPRLIITAIVIASIYLVAGRKRAWSIAVAALVVVGPVLLLDYAAGVFVGRIRPSGAEFLSFPSGHVLGSLVQFGFAAYLVARLPMRWVLRGPLLVILLLLIVFSGPSRLFLGLHWPSDVLGAYLLGAASLLALIVIETSIDRYLHRV